MNIGLEPFVLLFPIDKLIILFLHHLVDQQYIEVLYYKLLIF